MIYTLHMDYDTNLAFDEHEFCLLVDLKKVVDKRGLGETKKWLEEELTKIHNMPTEKPF